MCMLQACSDGSAASQKQHMACPLGRSTVFVRRLYHAQVELLHHNEDRALEAFTASSAAPQKLRIDFGWEGKEGEDVEGVELEFNALMYDIQVSRRGSVHRECTLTGIRSPKH